ncbi:hypothetical protein NKJ59_20115 [Mesorhizobium australicum]|uniref:hypothetical protein n=1 Tax=Mesorhizobium australicum TaxID=536018 RepID=UPI003338D083
MINLLIGIVASAFASWFFSRWYYRQSSVETPEWANKVPAWAIPLIQKLPDAPVSIERLIDLYHDAIQAGGIQPHPSGFIKCPECGAGADKFVAWQVAAPELGSLFHGYKCSECNCELTADED